MKSNKKESFLENLPSNYPVRIAHSLSAGNIIFTPQLVKSVVDGNETSAVIWAEITKLIEISQVAGGLEPIFPKKHIHAIQTLLMDDKIDVDDRYVRMVISGERNNPVILRTIFKVIDKFIADRKENDKAALKVKI